MSLSGLTEKQVKEKVREGKTNQLSHQNQNTIPKIILKSTLTAFNLVNLILALMIISVGAYKNLLFLFVAIANTLISIINGIRAKKTVDKMRLIAEQKTTVIRDGKSRQISQEDIVEGDLIIYSLGDQIIVDSKIEEGTVEVNESFITGEQENIAKKKGDQLISGSFVVSGACKATAIAVGENSELAKLEKSAYHLKTANSKLFTIINNIVKYISYCLIPIGALLLWSRFRVEGTSAEVAVTSTVAGLISMIPEGLVLLTSSVLALSTIRLSKKQVLVQDLYSIETLARVDTICLDKTGTLTTGRMSVHDYTPLEKSFESALEAILTSQTSENQTITALKKKFVKSAKNREIGQITETINFSSDRKYSGIKTKDATYLLGAIDFITDDKSLIKKVKSASTGYRTLAVVKKSSSTKLLGYVRLEDELRHDAKDIINYFYDNNIAVKIISGDDLDSVKEIAEKVGVKDLNGINLSSVKDPNYDTLVKEYSIFTRVTPVQKKNLIKAFRDQGSTVAMTGDGVNDILAMKEADCSMAIGEGADAARRSAKLILLNNDFGSVPSIIDEGRQTINNLERSATLFLSKNTYAAILAVIFILVPIEYPYAPIEMSLLNFLCIGLPGLVLALEKNTARIKDQFVKNIKKYSIPTGVMVAVSMMILSIVAQLNHLDRPMLLTLSAVITFSINIILIYRISRPLNLFRSALIAVIITLFILTLLLPLTHDLLFY
ncbi:HAD-IC family P-type ATPase [Candidatus Saccharibacteria bacterium]|nr:HAD-IC family P-type ATPase [Candidatus Saccharibacteria bacterium]